jgi:catechol 2,3-dioxygenase-like lactoylglutathione lyase family enzyme
MRRKLMFTHMFVGSNDVEKSRAFYDAALGALGHANVMPSDAPRLVYPGPGGSFIVAAPGDGNAATNYNGFTAGFAAADTAAVDAFHAAGVANGGTDEGAPGHRPQAPGKAYGAYLRDPDGHKVCAFCQMPE